MYTDFQDDGFIPTKFEFGQTFYDLDEQRVELNKVFLDFDDFNYSQIKKLIAKQKTRYTSYFLLIYLNKA